MPRRPPPPLLDLLATRAHGFEPSPATPDELPAWIDGYLAPREGQPAFRAHQFTVNDLTYPLIRNEAFAALPDPPDNVHRRFSLLAGLFTTRAGDLMFLFQYDATGVPPPKTVEDRRGIRGIFRVVSGPFSDPGTVDDPENGYRIYGACPACGNRRGGAGYACIACGHAFPPLTVHSAGRVLKVPGMLLPNRVLLEPLAVFRRTLGDNRAYADLSDPGLVWTGRHDNQMGAGKGSSTRHLLPEEAVKLTRLMLREPGQEIIVPTGTPYSPERPDHIRYQTGVPIHYRRIGPTGDAAPEFQLLMDQAMTIGDPGSPLAKALGGLYVHHDLEYVCSELPWGYTADEADFAFSLRRAGAPRYRAFVLENKRGQLSNLDVAQVALYAPWAAQVFCLGVDEQQELEVVPVLIGSSRTSTLVRPAGYRYTTRFMRGRRKRITVLPPVILTYVPREPLIHFRGERYTSGFDYADSSADVPLVDWRPEPGSATTGVEHRAARDAMLAARRV